VGELINKRTESHTLNNTLDVHSNSLRHLLQLYGRSPAV
jgi:hypothetical protein